ncbi:sodium/potassium/calcium exchanger 4-like [Physella acuta]|uniref:sodium/potassium/calcium exchanger 4-like n=1 Tax=Physella acuta TaxID=109671 RepID=UPI0027DE1840|nr:sodium/potassium/calcium exchanger 4-like [Physella acuta]
MPSHTKTTWDHGVVPAVTSGHVAGGGDTSPDDGETGSLGGDTGMFQQVGGETPCSCQHLHGDTVLSATELVGDTLKPPPNGDTETPCGDTTRVSIDRGVTATCPHSSDSYRTLGHYPRIEHTPEDPGPDLSTQTTHDTSNATGYAQRYPSITNTHVDPKTTTPEATPTSSKRPQQFSFSDDDVTGTPNQAEQGDKTNRHPAKEKNRNCCRYPWRRVKHRQMYRLAGMSLAYCLSIMCISLYRGMFSQDAGLEDNMGDDLLVRTRRQAAEGDANISCSEGSSSSGHSMPGDFLTKEQADMGGWLIHLFIGSYMFAAIAGVCDIYFVPSLEHICEDLDLQADVAGATFMAAASSAPEFCTSVIGVFLAQNDVGLGAIVGSSIFNLLVIIGCSAIFAGMPVQLTWYPLTRDTIFYFISIVLMAVFMNDSLIVWWEALVMIIAYIAYIGVMFVNQRLEKWAIARLKRARAKPVVLGTNQFLVDEKDDLASNNRLVMMEARRHSRIAGTIKPLMELETPLTKSGMREVEKMGMSNNEVITRIRQSIGGSLYQESSQGSQKMEKLDLPKVKVVKVPSEKPDESDGTSIDKKEMSEEHLETLVVQDQEQEVANEEEDDRKDKSVVQEGSGSAPGSVQEAIDKKYMKVEVSAYENPLEFPASFMGRCYYIFILPVTLLHVYTIPDSRLVDTWQGKLYLISFMMSVVYIALYSYIMVWMISLAGSVWKIPETITGLTVLAAGTSVPDLLSSVFVARDGYGDMAVSNAIGSNVFDILLCLGVPWLIDAAAFNKGGTPISSDGMVYATLTLFLTIAYLWMSMQCVNWTLTPIYGVITLIVYFVIITFVILIEMNVLFQIHSEKKC